MIINLSHLLLILVFIKSAAGFTLESENFRQNIIGGSENYGWSIAMSYCQ